MPGFRVTVRSSRCDVAATIAWLEANGLNRWPVVEVCCDAEGSALIVRHCQPWALYYVNGGPDADFVLVRQRMPLRHLPPPHIVERQPSWLAG